MTIDEIVTLIQAVSDNGLTSFVYEEGDQKRSTGSGCSSCDFPAGRSDDGHNADADGSRSGCGI